MVDDIDVLKISDWIFKTKMSPNLDQYQLYCWSHVVELLNWNEL